MRQAPIVRSLALLGLVAATACTQKGKEFVIRGDIKGIPLKKVYLTSISFDNKPILIMDSATVKDGKFVLHGPKEEALFRVMLGDPNNGPWMGVINDNGSVDLSMDATKDDNYKVSGSPASQRFHTLFDSLHVILDNIQRDRMASMPAQDSASAAAPADTAAARIRAEQEVKDFYTYLAAAVRVDPNPVVASFALNFYGIGANEDEAAQYGVATPDYAVDTLNALTQELKTRFPQSTAVAATAESVAKILDVPRVGSIAPDLTLPDTSGKAFDIRSLRGKYVLVDFWASWCEPCRMENPNVVKAYARFRNKNFAIVGVSLDQKKEAWLKAIHDDNLSWTQISDLGFWQSKAVETFQFNAIPYNILLDPQGKIIATSLKGDDLEAKLQQVLQ
ncbi:TlpA disulfide reductase family protein [Dinghuibacter silviterrae]|nr:TlpA disulfide reductase family protein [Dinghuibacter silviterrae]